MPEVPASPPWKKKNHLINTLSAGRGSTVQLEHVNKAAKESEQGVSLIQAPFSASRDGKSCRTAVTMLHVNRGDTRHSWQNTLASSALIISLAKNYCLIWFH